MSDDKLIVQVAISVRVPKGARFVVTKKFYQQIIDRLIEGKEIPKNVTVRGIFWRNPNRRGEQGYWRWHTGADLKHAPRPLESSARGSLQDAIDTLAGALSSGIVTFR